MILELDVGNSRIKWRQLNPNSESASDGEVVFARNVDELIESLAKIPAPQMIRMSSVRSHTINDAIGQWAERVWSLPVFIARVTTHCGGVRHQYQDQVRLGVDRWLAMLAAFKQAQGSCVIIDSGTALTIDVLDDTGLHLGGYITPGLQLMCDSLESNTRIRLTPGLQPDSLELGNSTDSAVRNGALAAQVNLINAVVAAALARDTQTAVYIAGGDAELLATRSQAANFKISPTLVLDGLAIACPIT